MKTLNVCFSANDNYGMQTGVTLVSILENVNDCKVNCYILQNDFSRKNLENFDKIRKKYDCEIHMIDITNTLVKISSADFFGNKELVGGQEYAKLLGAAAYSRLFISKVLPPEIDRVVYLDSDMIVCSDLSKILDYEIKAGISAVIDVWPARYNEKIHLKKEDLYFSAGLQWLDLDYIRRSGMQEEIENYLFSQKKQYRLFDQDIMNHLFSKKITILPLEYNLMAPSRTFNQNQICSFTERNESNYYTINEQKYALENPVVYHFAGDILGKPWMVPFADKYSKIWMEYYRKSPWGDQLLADSVNVNRKTYYYKALKRRIRKLINYIKGRDNIYNQYIKDIKKEIDGIEYY